MSGYVAIKDPETGKTVYADLQIFTYTHFVDGKPHSSTDNVIVKEVISEQAFIDQIYDTLHSLPIDRWKDLEEPEQMEYTLQSMFGILGNVEDIAWKLIVKMWHQDNGFEEMTA